MSPSATNGHAGHSPRITFLDLSYESGDSEPSALRLVYSIRPKWKDTPEDLEITKFTEGITNTLLRIRRKRPGASQAEIDDGSILMRAYGNNTDLLIDRDREAKSHGLLADRGMAPSLLARFRNGLLYGYIPGKVCTADDLTQEPVWRGVARKLGEWHARVPVAAISDSEANGDYHTNGYVTGGPVKKILNGVGDAHAKRSELSKRRPTPNTWSVMQKWINALSTGTEKERTRKDMLQEELERSFQELDHHDGIGEHGFVFAHCDLLCANVIQLPTANKQTASNIQPVTFIDYEYAAPAPAAFDISNHFAEWAGYDCDYSRLPTKSVRRAFIEEYVASYSQFGGASLGAAAVEELYAEVDRYRGIPGLYWGIWALIQARISQIDFDYASYAEERLGEYFAWRAELNGSRADSGEKVPLREQRWAED